MREILEQCVRIDEFAADAYVRLGKAVRGDDQLRETLDTLAREEAEHVTWWSELLDSWDEGLLPDILSQPPDVLAALESRWEEIGAVVPDDLEGRSPREIVAIAAQLEFFMLSPVLDELMDLVEPTRATRRRAAYRRHVQHLIGEIERLAADDPLVYFLSQVLQRTSRDNQTLSQFATHDALTGLRNRRSLNSQLHQWLAWSARYGRPLGVLLIDIDSFKQVNDEYGHSAGDTVLVSVASTLAGTVRGADVLARYGGDEFAVLAPEADGEELESLAGRLVDAVHELRMPVDGSELAVSVSVGATVVHLGRDITPEAALGAADQSLYEAKEGGRDRAGSVRSLPEAG